MTVYQLLIEDMTTLGAMGSSPTVTSRKLYSSLGTAQTHARIDYQKDITWTKLSSGSWSSGDLMYVMYTIRAIEVID